MGRCAATGLLGLAVLACPPQVFAQSAAAVPSPIHASAGSPFTLRNRSTPISSRAMDVWFPASATDTVAPITDFIQQEPDEGALVTERTDVWVMFDRGTIYIAARCWNSEPERIVANEMKRDAFGMFGNETFAVVLDTFYDRRNGVGFVTNALGGLFDTTITDEGRTYNMDWNAVWDVRSSRFEDGWLVEIGIPFKSLRYRSGAVQI